MEKLRYDHPTFKNKDSTKEAYALLQEHRGQYQHALDQWKDIVSDVSFERIIQILKKSGGSKDWIKHYGTIVFEKNPEIGLKLFTKDENQE